MRELMNEAVKMKMPAVAITDHGNLFGAIDFYQCAKATGSSDYRLRGLHHERLIQGKTSRNLPFIYLAGRKRDGYRNLVKLISAAHLDGFYYRPRIDKDLLAAHADGLIGLSGCLASEINSAFKPTTSKKRRI